MSYESINELDKFIFDDCQIVQVQKKDGGIIFTLEALIVGAKNSQNTNYTESYADTTTMVLRGAKIEEFLVEGYKLYDAEDNLQEEIPDKPISVSEYDKMIKELVNGYMFSAECIKKNEAGATYEFEVDMAAMNEDGLVDPFSTTYQITISFDEVRISWDRYLNRVQK